MCRIILLSSKSYQEMLSTLGSTGVKSRGGDGGMYPPTFLGGGGWPVQISPPPLFEEKITLNLTFIVKKLTFLTVKLLKTLKKSLARSARSHTNVFRDSITAVLPVHVFFFWHHLSKQRCRIKQTLCNSMARKRIAGQPIIQVKGTWRSQGGIILAQKYYQWLKSEIPHWNIVVSYASVTCAYQTILLKSDI